MQSTAYWLTNVRLETGYRYEGDTVIGTETGLFHLRIDAGKVAEIAIATILPKDDLPKSDAKGLLMLPAFKEMHIHIDKTYYGGPWRAVRPATSIFGRIEEERALLPKLLPTAKERAGKLLGLMLENGAAHVRTHCNIDPSIGLHNLTATLQALGDYSEKMTHEIVAFPQHGLLRSQVGDLVREAMRMGATHVGGVDPATVDGNIDKSLYTIFDIAVEANAGIDIHVHDQGVEGLRTLRKLADLTEGAGWQNRVTVSHAFAFASASAGEALQLAQRFAALGISVTSTVPFGRLMMPIPMLRAQGVKVELGNDSITDHWSPFGTGDVLELAGRLAELYDDVQEQALSQDLGYITGGKTPLDTSGMQVWPRVGDQANAVFVEASCSAETIARRAQRQAVLAGGQVVAGSLY